MLVSTGTQTSRTLTAAEGLAADGLAADGLDVGVVHVPVITPLDSDGLMETIGRRRLVITVEEHTINGGLGGAVAEVLAERGGPRLRRIGIQDTYGESGPNDDLLERHGLSSARVADRVRSWAAELNR